MKKLKLSIFSDLFFFFFIVFFITYYYLRYNFFNFALSLTFSSIISAILTCVFLIFNIIQNNKKLATTFDKSQVEKLKTQICFYDNDDISNLICSFLDAKNIAYKKFKDKIFLEEQNTFIVWLYKQEKLISTDIVDVVKKCKGENKIILFCNEISFESLSLIKKCNLPIKMVTIDEFYRLLKKNSILPEITIKSDDKQNLKSKLKNIFNKKKAKPFIISGGVIMLCSTLLYKPTFYIVIGSILMIIGSYLYFFAKDNTIFDDKSIF